jgi:hypothetical protein
MTRTTTPARAERARARAAAALLAAAALAAAPGCGSVLDVDNPNNVNAESLGDPASARAQVNGALAALTRAAGILLGPVTTASDDMSWRGSLEGMQRFDLGYLADPYNEFLEASYQAMTPARYTAARAVRQLEAFQAAGQLADPTQLALANLYLAIAYDYIANHHDDFVIASNEREAGVAVGPANMVTLYDSVEAAAARGLAVAGTTNAQRGALTAMRARAKFDRAVWRKINPSGAGIAAQPLVDDPAAAQDAAAALALLGPDARFQLAVQNGMAFSNCYFPNCTNARQEIRFDAAVATYNYTAGTLAVALRDPITGQPDPRIAPAVNEFVAPSAGTNLVSLTVTGSRDMLLIMAEVALARGETAEFQARINQLRALNALPAWTGAAGQPAARDLLLHERRANLFLQGRRLNDMYRFRIVDPRWAADADARTCPGTLLPINTAERLTNPNVSAWQPACGQ